MKFKNRDSVDLYLYAVPGNTPLVCCSIADLAHGCKDETSFRSLICRVSVAPVDGSNSNGDISFFESCIKGEVEIKRSKKDIGTGTFSFLHRLATEDKFGTRLFVSISSVLHDIKGEKSTQFMYAHLFGAGTDYRLGVGVKFRAKFVSALNRLTIALSVMQELLTFDVLPILASPKFENEQEASAYKLPNQPEFLKTVAQTLMSALQFEQKTKASAAAESEADAEMEDAEAEAPEAKADADPPAAAAATVTAAAEPAEDSTPEPKVNKKRKKPDAETPKPVKSKPIKIDDEDGDEAEGKEKEKEKSSSGSASADPPAPKPSALGSKIAQFKRLRAMAKDGADTPAQKSPEMIVRTPVPVPTAAAAAAAPAAVSVAVPAVVTPGAPDVEMRDAATASEAPVSAMDVDEGYLLVQPAAAVAAAAAAEPIDLVSEDGGAGAADGGCSNGDDIVIDV
jgi:hypothetical protein